jgi:glycerophosphoryl diester phosphodiesterase
MNPLRIAHRGASGVAPENTQSAFRKALELGVDLIETDVRSTRDGVLALLHDATVDRTTDGSGPLSAMSFKEAQSLDAGTWKGQAFAGERIPSLLEALVQLRNEALLLIEVKESGWEDDLVELLRETSSLSQVVIQSFDPHVVLKIKKREPRLPCGLLLSAPPLKEGPEEALAESVLEAVLDCRTNFAALSGRMVTPFLVQYLKKRGVPVWTWTLNDPEAIRQAKEAEVSGIISDFPDRV